MIFRGKRVLNRTIVRFIILFLTISTLLMIISLKKDDAQYKHSLNLNKIDEHLDFGAHANSITTGNVQSAPRPHRKSKKRVRDHRLGKLYGGPSNCQLYRPESGLSDSTPSDCILLKMKPSPYVCIHPYDVDKHISFTLEKDGIWEEHILKVFKQILLSDKGLGVLDIGANVGIYSLLAASLGHKVVAVEPHKPNLDRFHAAVRINGIENNVVLLQNAVSNRRGAYELSVPHDNQGGAHLTSQDADRFCGLPEPCPPWASTIVLDDLLEVANFERAVIKIDAEGHEHRALRTSGRFFDDVEVTHVLMEWQKLRSYYGSPSDESRDRSLVVEMIEMLSKRGFCPMDVFTKKTLSPLHWYGWPDDVIWIHANHSSPAGFPACR